MIQLWKKMTTTGTTKIIEKYDYQKRILERKVYEDKNNDGYFCDTELVSHSIFGYKKDGKRLEKERRNTDNDNYFDTLTLKKAILENGNYIETSSKTSNSQYIEERLAFERLLTEGYDKKRTLEHLEEFDAIKASNLSDEEVLKLSRKVSKMELAIE